jgi:hypothetical protein
MKRVLYIASILFSMSCYSQTLAEWTKQKKTQIKYLLQQIAANKVYLDYIEKGYGIARDGLNTIQNFKKGDFNLHQEFIGSLTKVNPKIKSYSRVADVISYQIRIVKDMATVTKNLRESEQFSPEELKYAKNVFDNLLEESLKNIDELYAIITSGELSMKDDERIKRIDQLYYEVQDKYAFCESFSEECSVLAMQRLNEKGEINLSKKLNEIK